MTNLLLLLLLLTQITLIGAMALVFLRFRDVKREIFAFFTAPDASTPSPFYQICDQVSAVFARSITAQIKTTLMGVQSGMVRGEKALAGAIAEDTLNQSSPLVGALLQSFPALGRTLRRNPNLVSLAGPLIEKMLAGRGQAPQPQQSFVSGNGNNPKFGL